MAIPESDFDYTKGTKGHLILPVFLLSTFLGISSIVYQSTLLVDIAQTFGVPIGTTSQMGLVINLVGFFLGLVMGTLTIKFNHKSLFLTGIALYGFGTLSFFFAPNFTAALLVNLVIGVGIGMMEIMVLSLIGDLMPLQKRGAAVGLNVSAMFLGFVIVGPLSGGISQVAGWRSVLLLFIFPLSMVCLILSLLVIPNKPKTNAEQISKPKYLEAYKQIFLNKSATFCLIGTTFLAIFNTIPVYAVSFYRIFFFTSPLTGGIFSAVAAAGGLFGGAAAGRLVNQYGRKLLTVTGAFIAGIFAILFTFMPIMWISVVFWAVSASLAAFTMAALFSLVLEQVPEFRASMMSTNSTFRAAGAILGIAIGGIVLNLYENNFQLLMTVFGASGIALAAVIFLFAKDPSKTQTASSPRNVKQ